MFSSILERYNGLINAMENGTSLHDVVEKARQIKTDQQQLLSSLRLQNESEIETQAKKRVIDFINSGRDDVDFFAEIESIRSQTQMEYAELFKNMCDQWSGILNNSAEHLRLLIQEQLSNKSIRLGTLESEEGERYAIEWIIRAIHPDLNAVHLLSNVPITPCSFHAKGYTHVEDEDVFGCAEVACSWRESDIRSTLNSEFFNRAFSDIEKPNIIPQRRHYNIDDFLIPNDVAEDKVYLLMLDEFLMLPPEAQRCELIQDDMLWWLGEQKARGWDDTLELPKIYAAECRTGRLTESTPDKALLPRVGITVRLDYLLGL